MANLRDFMVKFEDFINTASPELARQLVAPGASFYVPGQPEPLVGPDGYLAIIGMMRSGFSDIQWRIDDMVVENEAVAARFTMWGTHDGPFMGVPATGRPIQIRAMNFYRIVDGQIVEEFGQPDMLGLMMQIGAIPQP